MITLRCIKVTISSFAIEPMFSQNKDFVKMLINKNVTVLSTLGALGVVFGDIGTSPLYAMRAVLHQLPLNYIDVLGTLSLVFWSLIIVISLKYLVVIFRADNDGEGGVLALLALLRQNTKRYQRYLYLVGIFGAGLMLGDGMLTPAISVVSAIEGLEILSPALSKAVVPLSCVILVSLFMVQYKGTDLMGRAFGPILFVWFVTIGLLGFFQILHHPEILKAMHPYYAYDFFHRNGLRGFWLLGDIFLVVTGGEALYADMGHFGKSPIRLSWFGLVLPCLLLNYFGQGAHLLDFPQDINNPFYKLAPDWFSVPLIILSTLATIIASQAVISATFSLTKQAVLLGFYPRIPIIQTSERVAGQVYIPQVNFFLMLGTLLLIIVFQSSDNLADAYGIAVNLTMMMVTFMVGFAAIYVWRWSLWKAILIVSPFVLVDTTFFVANSHKLLTGAAIPVGFALLVAVVMLTWNSGIQFLKKNYYMNKTDIRKMIKTLEKSAYHRLPGLTAIFLTDVYDKSGGSFLQFLKLSRTLPEYILILSYDVKNSPHVQQNKRFELMHLGQNIYQLNLHFGFMDDISIPKELKRLNRNMHLPFTVDISTTTYFVEMPNVVASKNKHSLTFHWQEKLFAFMLRNYSSNLNISFYSLPFDRTIALGAYFMI